MQNDHFPNKSQPHSPIRMMNSSFLDQSFHNKTFVEDLYNNVILDDLDQNILEQQNLTSITIIQKVILFLYVLCFISTLIYVYLDHDFKSRIIRIIQQLNTKDPQMIGYVGLLEVLIVWIGLPIGAFEILAGAVLDDFIFTVSFVFSFKVIGCLSNLWFIQSLFNELVNDLFQHNKLYQIFRFHCSTSPFKVIVLFRLLLIPIIFKNIGIALFPLTFSQIVIPLLLVELYGSLTYVQIGRSFKYLFLLVDNDHNLSQINQLKYEYQITIGVITLVIVITTILWTRHQYYQMQQQFNQYHQDIQQQEEQDNMIH